MTTETEGVSAHERPVMSAFDSWADEWLKDVHPVSAAAHRRVARIGFIAAWGMQQAAIDRLMLEHCPGEMTPEQLAEWEQSQRAAKDQEFVRMSQIAIERGSGT
jgi:hypothetical protein